jgi:hypothetical protein
MFLMLLLIATCCQGHLGDEALDKISLLQKRQALVDGQFKRAIAKRRVYSFPTALQ